MPRSPSIPTKRPAARDVLELVSGAHLGTKLQIYTFPNRGLRGCITDTQVVKRVTEVGTLLASVDHDAYAGETRLRINVADGTWAAMNPQQIQALYDN